MGFIDSLALNFRKPTAGLFGKLTRFALTVNKPLEKNAVKLLKIQPHHKVLEIGFGPGHGIKYAMKAGIQNGTGKIVAVDFSSVVCDHARKRFAKDIASGKIEILENDVASMALNDCQFDKVFHTNSHLYWPDLASACQELYRVMKPGADMVTVIDLIRIQNATGKLSILKYAPNVYPDGYMGELVSSGFQGVDLIEVKRPPLPSLYAVVCQK